MQRSNVKVLFTCVCVCAGACKMYVKCVYVYVGAQRPVDVCSLSPSARFCLDGAAFGLRPQTLAS